jgi:hypothetical protein
VILSKVRGGGVEARPPGSSDFAFSLAISFQRTIITGMVVPLSPLKFIEVCRKHGLPFEVLGVFFGLTEGNISEFLNGCPADVLNDLRNAAARYPADADDEGWGSLVYIGSAYAPSLTGEQMRESRAEAMRRFREGVRVFRNAGGV